MRYTLTRWHIKAPPGEALPITPKVVNLIGEGHSEFLNAWWPSPEEVPLPREGVPTEDREGWKHQTIWRVAEIPDTRNILDCLPSEATVLLRVGEKGFRRFEECPASGAMEVLRKLVKELVQEWGGEGGSYWLGDLLKHSIMRVDFPGEFQVTWSPWGDYDESGGKDLSIPLEDEVSWVQLKLLCAEPFGAREYYAKHLEYAERFFKLFEEGGKANVS